MSKRKKKKKVVEVTKMHAFIHSWHEVGVGRRWKTKCDKVVSTKEVSALPTCEDCLK